MNFVADEGVDAPIVKQLREQGHQVQYVAEMSPGINDTAVLNFANEDNAILITADKDFGDLVYRQRRTTQGVILLRLHGLPPKQKAALIVTLVHEHQAELPQAFTVITPQKVRIRPRFN